MPEIVNPPFRAAVFVSEDPTASGTVAVVKGDGTTAALQSWDRATGDTTYHAPAGTNALGGTRRHVFADGPMIGAGFAFAGSGSVGPELTRPVDNSYLRVWGGNALGANILLGGDGFAAGSRRIIQIATSSPAAPTGNDGTITFSTAGGTAKMDRAGVWTFPGTLVAGTDPGGSEMVRIGGGLRATGVSVFTAGPSVSFSGAFLNINDTSGAAFSMVQFSSAGVAKWYVGKGPADNSQDFQIYNAALGATALKVSSATNAVTILASALIAGADPGGAEQLRVGGNARVSGYLMLSGAGTNYIQLGAGTGNYIGGGAAMFSGGAAADVALRSDSGGILFGTGVATIWGKMTAGALVWGTDPGGSDTIRAGGSARVSSLGVGQAAEANNAIAARSVTSTSASNMYLGRDSGGVVRFGVDGTGLLTAVVVLANMGRFTSFVAPTSLASTEIGYNVGRGFVQAVDRTGAGAYMPLDISGNSVRIVGGGGNTTLSMTINASGQLIVGTDPGGSELVRIGGALRTSGEAQIGGGVRQSGTVVARFENTFGTLPAGVTGIGVEMGVDATPRGLIQSFNRTAAAYAPLAIAASVVTLSNSGMNVTGAGTASTALAIYWDVTGGNLQSFSSLPLRLNAGGNSVIVGADPGGTAALRVGGGAIFNAVVTINSGGVNSTGGVSVAQSGANSLGLFINHLHATQPLGAQIQFTGGAPNNATQYFLWCNDGSLARCILYSNGGISNYSANNVNLSDERAKRVGETIGGAYASRVMADLGRAGVWLRYQYHDQTHDDDNLGTTAQRLYDALPPELRPSLIETGGDSWKDSAGAALWSVYETDLSYLTRAAVSEHALELDRLRSRVDALEAQLAQRAA